VKQNLDHLREIGNFGAHQQTDKNTGGILDIGQEEAEWTLDVIDGLFEYFIVARERDERRRSEMDKRLEKAGRPPIKKRESKGE
jgi:hypothetical protein